MTVHSSAASGLRRASLSLVGAALLMAPGVVLRFADFTTTPLLVASVYGVAILGAAFLLGAAGELAEVEVSASLALAGVALIAVLPEYAVDMVFAWKAADDPQYVHYAAANMTGSNRLLIGIGWSAVVLLFWLRHARRPVEVGHGQRLELTFLLAASAWAFTIFGRTLFRDSSLNMVDTVVLVALFIGYLYASSRGKAKDAEHIEGPMAPFARLRRRDRRLLILGLFAASGMVILAAAEPFAESLVETGEDLHIDTFILVQWVAPLASEAPEMGIAAMFALRGLGSKALGVLISSTVNQWTLLVGCLPLVYSISSGGVRELPLDDRQTGEFLLTAAQVLFAVLLIASLRVSWRGGLALLVLFATQVGLQIAYHVSLPEDRANSLGATTRVAFSVAYLGLSVGILCLSGPRRRGTWALVVKGVRSLRPGGPARASDSG